MPARQVLVLQHIGCEPPGVYADVLRERGATLVRVELDEGEALPGLDGIAAIVAMGFGRHVDPNDRVMHVPSPGLLQSRLAGRIREASLCCAPYQRLHADELGCPM